MATAGADYSAAPQMKPMCACTDHTHQQVRDAIDPRRLCNPGKVLPRGSRCGELTGLPSGQADHGMWV